MAVVNSSPPPGSATVPEGLDLVDATPLYGKGTRLLPLDENVGLPEGFRSNVVPSDPLLPLVTLDVVIVDGAPHCTQVTVRMRLGHEPVTGAVLRRVPLHRYLVAAVGAATVRYTHEKPPNEHPWEPWVIDGQDVWWDRDYLPQQADWDAGQAVAASAARRRRRELTESDLQIVADTYRVAVAQGKPPTRAVALAEHVSRTTASRWIARARDRGVLGPALPGRAGEHAGQETVR